MEKKIQENHVQFFTATILEWKHLLKEDKYKQIILDSLFFLSEEKKVKVFGFVIMPNHIHIIWQISDELKRGNVQRDFLKFISKQIISDLEKNHKNTLVQFLVRSKDRKYQIMERNALSIDIYSKEVFKQKLDYIHHNPIKEKWKLCILPENYPFSSASFYILNDYKFIFLNFGFT